MEEDESDSLLRAIVAAPAVRPPTREVTAMVIQLGAAAPRDDQVSRVRELVERVKGAPPLTDRSDGMLVALWTAATHAAKCALDIRTELAGTRIALATGTAEPTAPATAVEIVDRAIAMLDGKGVELRVDDATAVQLESRFELKLGVGGSQVVLVEPRASGTPPLVGLTFGNYKVTRLLGTGGMGVVYMAEHVSLGRKAVVKFVQDQLSATDEFAQRFLTEAKTAASIRHPGIVDVFDYGTDERGRRYIVMEYLDGESLRARLERDKVLPVELAVALAAQIASAVGAAHAAGIIHRDLKPDNVFLVPDPEVPDRVRAKVLDFGLAKVTTSADPGLTQTGHFVGTPLYMSPEQCRSTTGVDARTDIYSLGCILFEMVCGRPPFVDRELGELIVAHNSRPPASPRSLKDTVPTRLDAAILKALAKAPGDRFPTMEAFAAELAAIGGFEAGSGRRPTSLAQPAPVPRRRSLAVRGAIAAAALAAIATGVVVVRRSLHAQPPAHLEPAAHRSVAVIALVNQTGRAEDGWLGTALGEIVTTNLRAGGQLQIVPAADVARMKTDLGIGDGDAWTPDRLAKVRSDLGAEYAIGGSYTASGERLQVELDVLDTSTGKAIAHVADTGVSSDMPGLGNRLAQAMRRELGVPETDGAAAAVGQVLPTHATAARLYSEALTKLRHLDLLEARDLLVNAAADQPDDPLIHSALASVWSDLGYDQKAADEARLAFEHTSGLPRENKLAVEAQYHETRLEWDQAIEAYRTLFDFFPGRIDYGLGLANAQTRAGDVKSAYATLDVVRKLPPPLGNDPRVDLAEAAAAEAADDTERERVHADRAATAARARGARLLLAKALFREGWALWTLGRDQEADAAYGEAKQLFTALGDRSGLARCLNNMALVLHRGHRDDEATKAFSEGLQIAEQIGDTVAQAWLLQGWSYVLADQGELAHALELARKKLQLATDRGVAPQSQAAAHANIAEILRWQGDLDGAREHCETGDALLRGVDARRFAAWIKYQLGEVLHAEDDLAGARKNLEQASMWATDTMAPAEAAEIRIALARVRRDAGELADAEKLVRVALDDLRTAKEASQQVCALAVLSSILLQRGQVAEAARLLADRATLAAEGVSFACRLEADIAAARIVAVSDPTHVAVAVSKLHEVRDRADRAGFVELGYEIRLAMGELHGADLQALAKDATARKFLRVARLASHPR